MCDYYPCTQQRAIMCDMSRTIIVAVHKHAQAMACRMPSKKSSWIAIVCSTPFASRHTTAHRPARRKPRGSMTLSLQSSREEEQKSEQDIDGVASEDMPWSIAFNVGVDKPEFSEATSRHALPCASVSSCLLRNFACHLSGSSDSTHSTVGAADCVLL